MSDNKKYYYMRLKENFFDSSEMKILEGMKDGYLYSNILLKMYLMSLKSNGKLILNDLIPYNENMIATVTGHPIGVVHVALEAFKSLGLIENLEDGSIYMLSIQNFIGSSSSEADRKRGYRDRINREKSLCGTNVLGLSQNRPPEIEIEKEIKIETEIKKEKDTKECDSKESTARPKKHKYGEYEHVLLTDKERDTLFEQYGEHETLEAIRYLDEYIEMKGTKYKSHYLALRKWVFDAVSEKRAKKQPSGGIDWAAVRRSMDD